MLDEVEHDCKNKSPSEPQSARLFYTSLTFVRIIYIKGVSSS